MTKELYATICRRVNAAGNWFANTKDVDYCACMTAPEVLATDRENREDLRIFPELRRMGY